MYLDFVCLVEAWADILEPKIKLRQLCRVSNKNVSNCRHIFQTSYDRSRNFLLERLMKQSLETPNVNMDVNNNRSEESIGFIEHKNIQLWLHGKSKSFLN